MTLAEVARRVGRSRTAVKERLRAWRRVGFLLGYEVWPNPTLFGARLTTFDIPLRNAIQADRVLADLSLVDGVVSARVLLDEEGRTVRVYAADDGGYSTFRRERQLRRLLGTGESPSSATYWIPPASIEPSALDWRVLAYFRVHPEASLVEGARDLRISPKTLAHRRDRLLDGAAIWWVISIENSHFPVAAYYLTLDDPASRAATRHHIAQALPDSIPCADDGFGVPPTADLALISGLFFVETPAAIDSVTRRLASIPHVRSVRWRIPTQFRSYPEWFDQRLLERLAREGHHARLASWPLRTGAPPHATETTIKELTDSPSTPAETPMDVDAPAWDFHAGRLGQAASEQPPSPRARRAALDGPAL